MPPPLPPPPPPSSSPPPRPAPTVDERRLAESLLSSGRISQAVLAACIDRQRRTGGATRASLADILVREGHLTVVELDSITRVGATPPGALPGVPGSGSDLYPQQPIGAPTGRALPAPAPMTPIDSATIRAVADAEADPEARLGRYVLLDELGRGGMGVVYRGWDPGLRRVVAIKMILGGAEGPSPKIVARFVREARATARLRHPGIVSVHEVGEANGRPFIVMEFIDGCTLEDQMERAGSAGMGRRDVARIVEEVAHALHHAHGEGVIHRDVKPQNVLIDAARGRAHLTDFGAARDLGEEHGKLTITGQIVGTPLYMSPEQARGHHEGTGPRSDVWSLGALLYHALVGRPPFEGTGIIDLLPKIYREDPDPLRRVDPSVHADLETIALTCLEKDPARRYRSADALAKDLGRFLAGEPIEARPIGRRQRWRRWAARNRAQAVTLAVASVLIAALVVAGIAFAVWSFAEIRRERDLAKDALVEAETERGRAEEERRAADEQRRAAIVAQDDASRARERSDGARAVAERLLASTLAEAGRHAEAASVAAGSLTRGESAAARSVLANSFDRAGFLRWVAPERDAISVAWSVDGRVFATGGGTGVIRLWDAERRVPTGRLDGHGSAVHAIAFSPVDGDARVATASEDGTVRIWDAEGARSLATLRPFGAGIQLAVAWRRDGGRIATSGEDGVVRIWDVPRDLRGEVAEPAIALKGHRGTIPALAFAVDGRLASAGEDGTVRVWEAGLSGAATVIDDHGKKRLYALAWNPTRPGVLASSGAGGEVVVRHLGADGVSEERARFVVPGGLTLALAWSPEGDRIATGGEERSLRVWTAAGEAVFVAPGHADALHTIAWSADGTIATTSYDESLRLWHDVEGDALAVLDGHSASVYAVAWSPLGQRFATAGGDRTILVWGAGPDSHPRVVTTLRGHAGVVAAIAFSPDGTRIVSGSQAGELFLWDTVEGGEPLAKWSAAPQPVLAVAWRPDGNVIVSGGGGAKVEQHDPVSLAPRRPLVDHGATISALCWSADGRRLAVGSHPHDELREALVVAAGGKVQASFELGFTVDSIAFDTDAVRIATGTNDGRVRIFRIKEPGKPKRVLGDGSEGRVRALAWAPDGIILAWGALAGRLHLVDTRGQTSELAVLGGHRTGVASLVWAPDSRLLLSGGFDRAPRMWDVNAPRLMSARLEDHDATVAQVDLASDGRSASVDHRGDVIVRDARGERLIRIVARPPGPIVCVAWSPDDAHLAWGGPDGIVRVAAMSGPRKGQAVEATEHAKAVQQVSWSRDGTRLASRSRVDVGLWDAAAGKLVGLRPTRGAYTGHVDGESGLGIWAPWGRPVHLVSVADGRDEVVEAGGVVQSVAIAPGGARFAWGESDGRIGIASAGGGPRVRAIGHRRSCQVLAWSPDGRWLASGSPDRTVRVWDGATGRAISVMTAHEREVAAIAWSLAPDGGEALEGALLASSALDGTIHVTDPRTGGVIVTLRHESRREVRTLDWSDDGQTLASGGDDETVRLWNVALIRGGAEDLVAQVLRTTQLSVQGSDAVPLGAGLTSLDGD